MEISESQSLIKDGVPSLAKSMWADLGCGSGVFTYALAGLLQPASKVVAVDRSLQRLDAQYNGCEIEFIKSDIEHDPFPFGTMDGILLANALHYVKDQKLFIQKLKRSLTPGGTIILVEYDTEKSNPWVPYPVSFSKAKTIFAENGFEKIAKTGERQSVYRSEFIYACRIAQG